MRARQHRLPLEWGLFGRKYRRASHGDPRAIGRSPFPPAQVEKLSPFPRTSRE